MKICKECVYSQNEVAQGPGGYQNMLVCTHGECRDPVEGGAIPCAIARRELAFCSIKGTYFEPKADIEDAQIISLVKP